MSFEEQATIKLKCLHKRQRLARCWHHVLYFHPHSLLLNTMGVQWTLLHYGCEELQEQEEPACSSQFVLLLGGALLKQDSCASGTPWRCSRTMWMWLGGWWLDLMILETFPASVILWFFLQPYAKEREHYFGEGIEDCSLKRQIGNICRHQAVVSPCHTEWVFSKVNKKNSVSNQCALSNSCPSSGVKRRTILPAESEFLLFSSSSSLTIWEMGDAQSFNHRSFQASELSGIFFICLHILSNLTLQQIWKCLKIAAAVTFSCSSFIFLKQKSNLEVLVFTGTECSLCFNIFIKEASESMSSF